MAKQIPECDCDIDPFRLHGCGHKEHEDCLNFLTRA
jgi:hypothetical protein